MDYKRSSNIFLHRCRVEIQTALPVEFVRSAIAAIVGREPSLFSKEGWIGTDGPTPAYLGEPSGTAFTVQWNPHDDFVNHDFGTTVLVDIDIVSDQGRTRVMLRGRHGPLARLMFRGLEVAFCATAVWFLLPAPFGADRVIALLCGFLSLVVYIADLFVTREDMIFPFDGLLRAIADAERAAGIAPPRTTAFDPREF